MSRWANALAAISRRKRLVSKQHLNEQIIETAIASGPDCVHCGHARSLHRTKIWFDGRCQVPGCTGCCDGGYSQPGGYVPAPEIW